MPRLQSTGVASVSMPKRQASVVWYRTGHVYATILAVAVAVTEDARACPDASIID